MINSYGILKYRPNYWLIVDVDYELGKYLRRLFLFGNGTKLQKPSWNEHITVVSHHETIANKELWGIHEGIEIEFRIKIETLYHNGNAYWYDVVSDDINYIRIELGLSNPREIPLHFAFGYLNTGKIENV